MSLFRETRGLGADLMLVHGWGMNGAVWAGLDEQLAGQWRLTLPDLPGHGQSPWEGVGSGLDDWVAACLAVAPARAVWIGWSLGGALALAAALAAPQRVRGLVLMTATPRFVQAPDWSAAMPAATLERFHQDLLADPRGTLDRFLALEVRGSAAAVANLRLLRRRLALKPPPAPEALGVGLDLLRDTDLRRRLPEITCPSLWLFGERDQLVPRQVAAALPALLPGARIGVIPGAAHAPFLSHPQAAWGLLAPFLETLP